MRNFCIHYTPEEKDVLSQRVPFLPWTSFDLPALMDEIRQSRVPEISHKFNVFFVEQRMLACINYHENHATIFLHQLFNTPHTPRIVFSMVFTHEMLHLIIPPREIDGKEIKHPPEFFIKEKMLSPEYKAAWGWIILNFCGAIIRDKKREQTLVRRRWRQLICSPFQIHW